MDILQSVFSNVWSVFLVVLFFGGSIFVHELGHFLAARWRGVRVERFSIGFGPKIFSWRGRDGVEYQLAWVPFGGYVALPQLADMSGIEGETTSDVSKLPPVSYGSRVLVFVAGAVFNVLFAAVLSCLLWAVGMRVAEEEQSTVVGGVLPVLDLPSGQSVPGPAYVAKIQPNDIVRAVDGKKVSTFNEIEEQVFLGSGRGTQNQPKVTLTIERAGKVMDVDLFPQKIGAEGVRYIGIEPRSKVMVEKVLKDSAAAAAGLKAGDQLLSIDEKPIAYVGFVSEYLRNNNEQPVKLTVQRDDSPLTLTLTPRRDIDLATKAVSFRLGVSLQRAYTEKRIHVPPVLQLKKDFLQIWRNLNSLLNPRSDVGFSKMQGAVGIAHQMYSAAKFDFGWVLWLVLMVNISLAIFNLLPIPVLDGGHILFATITKLRGRSLPGDFVAGTQSVFVVLLFSALIYLGVRDVQRIVSPGPSLKAPPAAQPASPAPSDGPAAPLPAKP
jgi:regulator of sigma E protease